MTHSKDRTKVPVNRLVIGMTVLVTGFLSPLAIPLVAASGLPPRWTAAISGFLLLGIPEMFMLLAISIMGKESLNFLKQKLAARLRQLAPPDEVGLLRYRFGLLLFSLPLLFGWLLPYFLHLFPGLAGNQLWLAIPGDLLLLASLVVLGGNFWDKLRSLFIHSATAQFHKKKYNDRQK